MNIEETLGFIHSVNWRGSKPGLSRTRELLEKMGKYPEAAEAYRHALKLDQAAVICMHNLGMLYINHLDKREEGLGWLKNTLKYDPQRWFKLPSELRNAVDNAKYADDL